MTNPQILSNSAVIRVLLVECPAKDAQSIKELLSKERDPSFAVEGVNSQKLGLERALKGGFDVALLSETALKTGDPQAIEVWTQRVPALPLVVLMDAESKNRIFEIKKKGAQDYLLRSEMSARLLSRVIGYAIERKHSEIRMTSVANMGLDFVSLVSHELRAPLAITKEGVSLVLDKILGKTNLKQQQVLRTARKNIDRLDQILMNMLDISRIEAGKVALKKQSFDFTDLVKQVAGSLDARIQAKGLVLKVSSSREKIELVADKKRIFQVLMNLVGNAAKFTEKGFIEVTITDHENEIECSVSDTGVGISGDDLPKIFGKFQQLGWAPGGGEKGMGLELAITKAIVELHNGRIQAESRLGKGSCFTFSLPKEPRPRMKKN